MVPEGAAPGEVVPEAGPGCLGGSASGREGSKSQRPAPQRHLYLYCVSTKERDRGGGGASKAAALGGAITSPDIPYQQCRLSHPRGVDLTCHQVLPSPLNRWLRLPCCRVDPLLLARGCRHPADPAGARAAASQSPVQKHRDSVRITQLGLQGDRAVDQCRVLLEGTRASQRNHHRGLQGRCGWFGTSQ